MTDIYDLARPIRDAALVEVERLTGGANFCPNAKAANILGVQLSAVLLAYCADRHKQTGGVVRDDGLHIIMRASIGTLIANAAMAFRPVINGQPVPPSAIVNAMLHDICASALHQTALNEQGLQDFVVSFERSNEGSLEVKPFDFSEMLKGKP
ncbi:MAG: hypothetical protein PS018_17265 [bacterium]|nr:hypothetical protein [bacterium]